MGNLLPTHFNIISGCLNNKQHRHTKKDTVITSLDEIKVICTPKFGHLFYAYFFVFQAELYGGFSVQA